MRNVRHNKTSPERGQATVDFMVSAILLMTFIFAALQYVLLMYTYVVMSVAAKEGVRYAVAHGYNTKSSSLDASSGPASGSSSDCATNFTAVDSVIRGYANYSGMTVSICYLDGNNKAPNRVRVELTYPFVSIFTLGGSPGTVKAAAQGRIVY